MNAYSCGDDLEQFFRRLPQQSGRGILPDGRVYFAGVRQQRGAGLGGIFGTKARYLLPFARKVVLPRATAALQNLATDISEGKNLKASLKQNSFAALKAMGNDILNQKGSGRRQKRVVAKKRKAPRKKRVRKSKGVLNKRIQKKGKSRKRKTKRGSSNLRSIFS